MSATGNIRVNRESNLIEAVAAETISDWECVQRVQKGETAAFELLVQRHQKKIFNLAYRMLGGDYEEATDAAQEVFLLAYRSIGQFRGDANFSTWIFRIALNHASSRRRNLKSRQQKTVALDVIDPADTHTPEPAAIVEQRETRKVVQSALNTLSDEHREIVVLIDMQGTSYEDAAAMLDIPVNTVKSRLYRARRALAPKLAPFFGDRKRL
jgi:RNA polymerase sigma-70 factor (ECF subfamily)